MSTIYSNICSVYSLYVLSYLLRIAARFVFLKVSVVFGYIGFRYSWLWMDIFLLWLFIIIVNIYRI